MPNNDLALTTGSHEVAKTQGNKRQPDKWSTYPERSILDIIMATEVSELFLYHVYTVLINIFVQTNTYFIFVD